MEERTADRDADNDEDTLVEEEDIEIEMALLSLLAARDVGDPTEPVDLHALSATEKQVLLQMMRARIGFVEPMRLESGATKNLVSGTTGASTV